MRPQQGLPGPQQMGPAGFRPPQGTFAGADGQMHFNQQKASVLSMVNSHGNQHSNGEQNSFDSKPQETAETEKKAEDKENMILDSRGKVEFYRNKMQDLDLDQDKNGKSYFFGINRKIQFLFSWSAMEAIVKKYQQKFRKVREDMNRWDELQSRLISQIRNASSIIERLQVIQDPKNHGSLNNVSGIGDAILAKQMDSLQSIMLSMNKTLEDFNGVVLSLGKTFRDGRQLVKGGSLQPTAKQLQQHVGIKPSLADCLEGLRLLHEMHQSEYLLKSSVVSALAALTLEPSASDLGALQQLLIDQPNIPKEEVQDLFDIIFAEEIC